MRRIFIPTFALSAFIALPSSGTQDKFGKTIGLKQVPRLSVDSGLFCSDKEDTVDFHATYNGWDILKHKRIRNVNIEPQLFENIRNAKSVIVASFFLFDTMYSTGNPESKVTDQLTQALLEKKKENPDIKIAVILDPLNRAYSRRVAKSLQLFEANGIDVFFSDLLKSKPATKFGILERLKESGSALSWLTGGLLGSAANEVASWLNFCLPGETNGAVDFEKKCVAKLDEHGADLEMAFEAILLKANHRKILVTDSKIGDWRAIVSSANPHNASDDSTNTALSVEGEVAKFIYNSLREDLGHSLRKEFQGPLKVGKKFSRKYAWLSKESEAKYPKIFRFGGKKKLKSYLSREFPLQPVVRNSEGKVCSQYVSEIKIKHKIIELLGNSEADDEIRIQMFYLSDPEVVEAIINASKREGRKLPIRLILDPSKDAFNSIKDGTPNRQAAHAILQGGEAIEIRWYATHGEQNHAKAMSITNKRTSKNIVFTGSANWTGKNLNDINMESNLLVQGSEATSQKFETLFNKLWGNTEKGVLYTWDYSAYSLHTTSFLNLGYERIKELSEAQKAELTQENLESVKLELLTNIENSAEQSEILDKMSEDEIQAWLVEKLEKDPSAKLRALSIVEGRKVFQALTPKQQDAWFAKYMKKWKNGERFGYVSW